MTGAVNPLPSAVRQIPPFRYAFDPEQIEWITESVKTLLLRKQS